MHWQYAERRAWTCSFENRSAGLRSSVKDAAARGPTLHPSCDKQTTQLYYYGQIWMHRFFINRRCWYRVAKTYRRLVENHLHLANVDSRQPAFSDKVLAFAMQHVEHVVDGLDLCHLHLPRPQVAHERCDDELLLILRPDYYLATNNNKSLLNQPSALLEAFNNDF